MLLFFFSSIQATTMSCMSEMLHKLGVDLCKRYCLPELVLFLLSLSHLQRLYVLVYTGYKKVREDLSDGHSTFQNALCTSGITAAFCDTSDAVKNRLQAKYYSSDTVVICFLSVTLYSLQHSRCQNPEVDSEAKQK